MVQFTSLLTWRDSADPTDPLASYSLNFTLDTTWSFNLSGSYQQQTILPRGVMVDNSLGASNVTLSSGPNTWIIVPYTRKNIRLPERTHTCQFVGVAGQTCPVAFFIHEPSDENQNQNAIAIAAAAAVASTVLGTVNPIINSKFDVWLAGTTFDSTGAALNAANGWQINAASGLANCARSNAPFGFTHYGAQIGRKAAQTGTTSVQFGTQLETPDSYTFQSNNLCFAFDISFGLNYSGQTPVTWEIHGGTGNNENVFAPFSGDVVLLTGTVAYSATGQRVSVAGSTPIPSNITELGIIFKYNPSGTAGAAENFVVSRIQFDTQTVQSFRPVPYEFEIARINAMGSSGAGGVTPKAIIRWSFTASALAGNISSVDIATEIITWSIAHGLTTGDFIYATGGVWPAGFLNGAYARALSGTTLALYLTYDDAIADTARINLTSAGSGTRTASKLLSTIALINGFAALVPIRPEAGAFNVNTAPSVRLYFGTPLGNVTSLITLPYPIPDGGTNTGFNFIFDNTVNYVILGNKTGTNDWIGVGGGGVSNQVVCWGA